MKTFARPLLTPALLLHVFARQPGSQAHRILGQFAAERSFRLEELAASAEALARSRPGNGADFNFTAQDGQPVPLSDEMLVVLDEGRSIAQASDELSVGTEHALGAMAESGVSTAAVLRRYGITSTSMTNRLVAQAQTKRLASQDVVQRAREGEAGPVYVRADLMRDLSALLALAESRHVLLVGDAGVGKRSLVQALGLQMAEGKGPPDLGSLVHVPELALLDDAGKAVETAWRQARDGILFIPNVERFFSSSLLTAEFPKGAARRTARLPGDEAGRDRHNYGRRLERPPAARQHRERACAALTGTRTIARRGSGHPGGTPPLSGEGL